MNSTPLWLLPFRLSKHGNTGSIGVSSVSRHWYCPLPVINPLLLTASVTLTYFQPSSTEGLNTSKITDNRLIQIERKLLNSIRFSHCKKTVSWKLLFGYYLNNFSIGNLYTQMASSLRMYFIIIIIKSIEFYSIACVL